MATNEVLVKNKLQFLVADHGTDFGGAQATAANSLIIGAPTDVQLDLTGVAAGGGARQAAKVDFTTPWGALWLLMACLEFESAPADGGLVEFYLAPSPSATAGTGNPGGTTGADAAFTDTLANLGQLQNIGVLVVRHNAINIVEVCPFSPAPH